MRGGGTPSARHINRAVPALGRVWLSGLSTMDGGTKAEAYEKSDEKTRKGAWTYYKMSSNASV